jgi:hypothetical protein
MTNLDNQHLYIAYSVITKSKLDCIIEDHYKSLAKCSKQLSKLFGQFHDGQKVSCNELERLYAKYKSYINAIEVAQTALKDNH